MCKCVNTFSSKNSQKICSVNIFLSESNLAISTPPCTLYQCNINIHKSYQKWLKIRNNSINQINQSTKYQAFYSTNGSNVKDSFMTDDIVHSQLFTSTDNSVKKKPILSVPIVSPMNNIHYMLLIILVPQSNNSIRHISLIH